jgi:hypothetical protein
MIAFLLAGCAAVDGVWLFSLHVDPNIAEECVNSVSHNFDGASQPQDDSVLDDDPWSSTAERTLSDQTFFGLITGTDTGAVLVVGGETYTGTLLDGGAWSFAWTHSQLDESTDQHASGYGWTVYASVSESVAFDLVFAGDVAVGEVLSTGSVEANYSESDAWSQDVADSIGTTGRIPAGSYLVKDDGAGGTYAASNDWSLADCSNTPCTLSLTTSCSLSVGLDAERTDLDPAAFEAVDGAGQDAGI